MEARTTKEYCFNALILSVSLCLFFPSFVSVALAQQPTDERAISSSELAKDNLDRVAASEAQITAVLNANPGLFV